MLRVGTVVTYESATRGPIRAVITKGPNADGTWDLDVKPGVALSRIRCVQQFVEQAPPVTPAQSASKAPSRNSAHSAPLQTQEVLHRSTARHRPVGTVCFYKSASRGWISARVTRFCNQSGMYDLDCKVQAAIECIFWIDEGSSVEYYSTSQNKWLPARVLRAGRQPGTFDLDCREAAEVQRMRPRGSNSGEKQNLATLQAMPGMMCFSEGGGVDEPSAIQYETHKADIRLRPRSKTPDSRRASKEEIQIEQEVRNDLSRAIRQGTPEVLQAAISRANGRGISTGPELAHAIQVLHSMGGRLQRTPSCDAINGPAPEARVEATHDTRQGVDAVQNYHQSQQGVYAQEEPEDEERQRHPNDKPGILTRMLGPKPSDDAGLLTRVLGPKPTEEAGFLERVFGPEGGLFKWGEKESPDDSVTNHDMYRSGEVFQARRLSGENTYSNAPLMTGAVERSEDPPTEPNLKLQQSTKIEKASIESPYKPVEEGRCTSFGSQAPPTDPQLQNIGSTGGHQNQQQFGLGFQRPSSNGSSPPTDPKLLNQASRHNAGMQQQNSRCESYSQHVSPPTDPKLLPYRSGQSGCGSAPPTDPKLQGYGTTHQPGPTSPHLQQFPPGGQQLPPTSFTGAYSAQHLPPTTFGGSHLTNPPYAPRIS